MRALYTLAASLLLLSVHAQWPTDPNAPLVICNDPSDQADTRLVADGDGGWYVLWRDNRLGGNRYGVFGQRLDAQGNLLWEPSGRLIQEVPGRSINFIGASRFANNNLFLAYISGADPTSGDTVRAMAYDNEGAPLWAEPTLLAYPGPLPGGGTSGGNYYPRVAAVLGGAYVGWGCNPAGAADYIYIARVKPDGTTDMPEQGVAVTTMNNPITAGPWTFRHDLVGGLMIERRWGNGAGAPLRAQRVDSMGVQLWPSILEVSANSSGLGYEWSSAIAPNTRMNSVWGYGYDLRMSIYDTTGVLLSSPTPIDVCLQADVQENPFVVQSELETTVFWADNRSSAGNGRQVFMQRFDADGTPLLATDGILAMQCDGNLNGFPRAITAENGSHIVAMYTSANLQGGTAGFRVGRVTPTGTNMWSDTTRFTTGPLGPNGGTEFSMVSDGDGGVAAFWFNWQNNAIYAARLDRNGRMGDFTSVAEHAQTTFSVFPNPAAERITLQSRNGGPLGEVRIHAADGRVVREMGRMTSDRAELDVTGLPNGLYTAIVSDVHGRSAIRFVKQ
ncbi:MAG TPA: T9SS type A sorting domain-containing protein [Flavobacteriales bacterium]|nr:T9SS type A sorting domain-containing protein [Flavobacteriales bacterium]